MKKILTLIIGLAVTTITYSQKEISSVSASGSGVTTAYLSDYQCLGINPANLGFTRDSAVFHVSLLEIGASVYSDALQKKEIKQDFIFGHGTSFTKEEKLAAAEDFVNNKFSVNLDVAWLSLSFQKEKFGGLGFTVRERTNFNTFFNKDFSEIVFEGYNASYFDSLVVNGADTAGYVKVPKTLGELADGSKVAGVWYREYVLGYGKKIISSDAFSLYAGVGVKYIAGYGIMDIKAENKELSGFSAFTPFVEVNYANITPSEVAGSAMKTVGSGFGFDLGATIEIKKKLKISAALNDIGSIKWDGNVYQVADTLLNNVNFDGFSNFNMIKEMKGLIQDSSVFNWKGQQSESVGLPTNMRFGVNYLFGFRSSIGADCYIPVNDNAGSFDKAIIGGGASICFFKMLTLSAGFYTGGNSGFVIPMGVTISSKDNSWQMGIASRDIVIFVKKDNPTVSVALGFIKFCFGKYK